MAVNKYALARHDIIATDLAWLTVTTNRQLFDTLLAQPVAGSPVAAVASSIASVVSFTTSVTLMMMMCNVNDTRRNWTWISFCCWEEGRRSAHQFVADALMSSDELLQLYDLEHYDNIFIIVCINQHWHHPAQRSISLFPASCQIECSKVSWVVNWCSLSCELWYSIGPCKYYVSWLLYIHSPHSTYLQLKLFCVAWWNTRIEILLDGQQL